MNFYHLKPHSGRSTTFSPTPTEDRETERQTFGGEENPHSPDNEPDINIHNPSQVTIGEIVPCTSCYQEAGLQ